MSQKHALIMQHVEKAREELARFAELSLVIDKIVQQLSTHINISGVSAGRNARASAPVGAAGSKGADKSTGNKGSRAQFVGKLPDDVLSMKGSELQKHFNGLKRQTTLAKHRCPSAVVAVLHLLAQCYEEIRQADGADSMSGTGVGGGSGLEADAEEESRGDRSGMLEAMEMEVEEDQSAREEQGLEEEEGEVREESEQEDDEQDGEGFLLDIFSQEEM